MATAKQIEKALLRAADLFKKRSFKRLIGNEIRQIIFRRVKGTGRAGKGINPSDENNRVGTARLRRLKSLSPGYVEFRKNNLKFFTAPAGHVYPVSRINKANPETGKRRSRKADRKVKSFFAQNKVKVTGSFGKPNRSNLTFSGEMLDSMRVKILRRGISVEIPNTRRSDGMSNRKVAELVSDGGRPFMNLSRKEFSRILRIIDRELDRELERQTSRLN